MRSGTGYYAAKFKREAKANPGDWVIKPNRRSGGFELVRIVGGTKDD